VRFEPGDTKLVNLVDIAGGRVIRGGNNLAAGPVTIENRDAALQRIADNGFSNQPG